MVHGEDWFLGVRLLNLSPADGADGETIRYLQHALAEAWAGRVVGVAVVLLHADDGYSVHLTGETRQRPVFTRGVLPDLEAELSTLAQLNRPNP